MNNSTNISVAIKSCFCFLWRQLPTGHGWKGAGKRCCCRCLSQHGSLGKISRIHLHHPSAPRQDQCWLGPLPACLPNLFLKAWVMPSCILCPCSLVFVLHQEKSHPCFPNPSHMLFWFHLNPILTSSSRFFFKYSQCCAILMMNIGWGMKILAYQKSPDYVWRLSCLFKLPGTT